MKILFVIVFALLPSQVTGLALANPLRVPYFLIQPTYRFDPLKGEGGGGSKKPKYPPTKPTYGKGPIRATKARQTASR